MSINCKNININFVTTIEEVDSINNKIFKIIIILIIK